MAATAPPDNEVIIDTAQGRLKGSREKAGALCFRSVPYAAPPVGPLRFQPPRSASSWEGVRDATRLGPIAPQLPSRLANVMGACPRELAEDCLTLTVWTPDVAGKRPVLVWLHGGAFTSGAGDLAWYDGGRLAQEQGLVVVGVNYRLGALGFLVADGVSNGNLGLMDQEAALEWVRDHIAAFGGDASQVTVIGQSAGGISIAHLLGRPGWSDRCGISRAIILSSPMSLKPQPVETARRIGDAFLKALDIEPGSADALQRAQAAPLDKILAAQGAASRFYGATMTDPLSVEPPFIPVADGEFLGTGDAFDAALEAGAGRVDVIIGSTREESMAFFADNPLMSAMDPIPLGDAEISHWRARRPGASTLDVLVDSGTWDVFERGTVAWADAAAKAGRQAFLYRFDWAGKASRYAAAHCIDLPFVFGSLESFADAPMLAGGDRARMEGLSAVFRAAIGGFVREGVPAGDGVAAWPPCRPGALVRMHLDTVCETQGMLSARLPFDSESSTGSQS